MTEEAKVTFIVTDLSKLSFNLEMPVSELINKINEISDASLNDNFEQLSERVRVTIGELSLPSLSEEVLIRELWSRDAQLLTEHLNDTQQLEILTAILLTPGNLTEEFKDVVAEAYTKNCAGSLSTIIENYSMEEIVEELADNFTASDILTELARHV